MRFSVKESVALAFLVCNLNAFAQTAAMPSNADIQAAMKDFKASSSATAGINLPKSAPAPLPQKMLEKPAMQASATSQDEISQLVETYKKKDTPQAHAPSRKDGDLMVFVSFSMPKEVLKELARQAKEVGAVLVLRGMKEGSIKKTKEAATELNPTGAAWDINPGLFTTFQIKTVPTFVLSDATNSVLDSGCAQEASYSAISGDISFDVALDTIRRRSSGKIAKIAELRQANIKKMRDTGRLRLR